MATRGRQENRLLVVTTESDLAEARDVLEQVLSNERADVPAVVQRRNLAAQQPPAPPTGTTGRSRAAGPAPRSSPPVERPPANPSAPSSRVEAERRLAARRQAMDEALRRAEPFLSAMFAAEERVLAAHPYAIEVEEARGHVDRAEREASVARVQERL